MGDIYRKKADIDVSIGKQVGVLIRNNKKLLIQVYNRLMRIVHSDFFVFHITIYWRKNQSENIKFRDIFFYKSSFKPENDMRTLRTSALNN